MDAPRRAEAVALALLAAAAGAGVVLWGRLPARMAVHFDAAGAPDGFASKPVAVFLAPAAGAAGLAVVRVAPRLDPTGADPRVLAATSLFLGAAVAYVQALVLAWNLGYRVDVGVAVLPVLVGAGALTWYAYRHD